MSGIEIVLTIGLILATIVPSLVTLYFYRESIKVSNDSIKSLEEHNHQSLELSKKTAKSNEISQYEKNRPRVILSKLYLDPKKAKIHVGQNRLENWNAKPFEEEHISYIMGDKMNIYIVV